MKSVAELKCPSRAFLVFDSKFNTYKNKHNPYGYSTKAQRLNWLQTWQFVGSCKTSRKQYILLALIFLLTSRPIPGRITFVKYIYSSLLLCSVLCILHCIITNKLSYIVVNHTKHWFSWAVTPKPGYERGVPCHLLEARRCSRVGNLVACTLLCKR